MKERISLGWFSGGALAALLLVFSSFVSKPHEGEKSTFTYAMQSSLSWDDFKARVGVTSVYKALTYSGIQYKIDQNAKGRVVIEVDAYFDKDQSWVNADGKTPELLNHEQRHFDIAAIYAAQMRKELEPYQGREIAKFVEEKRQNDVKIIFNNLYDEMEAKQRAYDQATKHSTDLEQQVKWDKWIDEQMKKWKIETINDHLHRPAVESKSDLSTPESPDQ